MGCMDIEKFSYHLPKEKVALFPPKNRGDAKLLVLHKNGSLEHKNYADLHQYLSAGDVLVVNNTKVIPTRIMAKTKKGTIRELLLLEKHQLGQQNKGLFRAIYRGKIKKGDKLFVGKTRIKIKNILPGPIACLSCDKNLYNIAQKIGSTPLPPYIKRPPKILDRRRYQTIFAKHPGSSAAPTASLNFTRALEKKIKSKKVKIEYLTLHVGLGTFMPIRTNSIENHKMQSEWFYIPMKTIKAIRKAKQEEKKIIAVGTTVARSLEYSAAKILSSSTDKPIQGEADNFIYPGYNFQVVDILLTNFHAPRSTVLLLAAAFAGWTNLKKAYKEAMKKDYKFLSYGDSMLILP